MEGSKTWLLQFLLFALESSGDTSPMKAVGYAGGTGGTVGRRNHIEQLSRRADRPIALSAQTLGADAMSTTRRGGLA